MLLFGVWYLVSVWGALLSPHAFRHYLVPTIPPLLLIAGYLINVLQAEMRLLVRMQQRAWVTAAFVLIRVLRGGRRSPAVGTVQHGAGTPLYPA